MNLTLQAKRLNAVLLLWLTTRFINLFFIYFAQHVALKTEARLLVNNLCDTAKGFAITGALINCNQARQLLNSNSFAVSYAIEHALKTIVYDAWSNAKREVASFAQLLGLLTTILFTLAFVLQYLVTFWMQLAHNRRIYGETSLLDRAGFHRIPLSVKAGDERLRIDHDNKWE